MAIYQGTRLRTTALPERRVGARVRAAARPVVASVPRPRPTALLMAGILAATMVGFTYLTQTLASNATSAELDALQVRLMKMEQTQRSLTYAIETWRDTDVAVRATKLGLADRPHPLILKAP
jgi:hypothetical protein